MLNKQYLLDTNIISECTKPTPNRNVLNRIVSELRHCSISSISWFELLYGVKRMPEGKRKKSIENYLYNDIVNNYRIIPYTKTTADVHSDIMKTLNEKGFSLPYADSQIASVAFVNNLTLVTRNVKDFEIITKFFPLEIENWFE